MTWMLIAAVCLLTSFGQVAQKVAVSRWRSRATDAGGKWRSPWLWAALLSMGLGLLLWLHVLQRLEVGVAYAMLSLNFVLVTLVARCVFAEPTDGRHWLGVVLIVAGVAVMALSS
jgi:undecaprenyl phosphate-alpha-L-ara4N flippase subunit ArnE